MIHPDVVLHHGLICTVDSGDTVVEAVAIHNGDSPPSAPHRTCWRWLVQLRANSILKGAQWFRDLSMAIRIWMLSASAFASRAFDGAGSIDDVLAAIRNEVARRKPGEWIVCNPLANEPEYFAFPGILREGRWPNRYDLDKVAPDNPVYIEPSVLVAPGIAIANSAAICIAGITGTTEVPAGVEIDTDANGEPTGIFCDFNFPKAMPDTYGTGRGNCVLFPMIPAMDQEEMNRAVEAGIQAFQPRGCYRDL